MTAVFLSVSLQFGSAVFQRSGSLGFDRFLVCRRFPVVQSNLPERGSDAAAARRPRPRLTPRSAATSV